MSKILFEKKKFFFSFSTIFFVYHPFSSELLAAKRVSVEQVFAFEVAAVQVSKQDSDVMVAAVQVSDDADFEAVQENAYPGQVCDSDSDSASVDNVAAEAMVDNVDFDGNKS